MGKTSARRSCCRIGKTLLKNAPARLRNKRGPKAHITVIQHKGLLRRDGPRRLIKPGHQVRGQHPRVIGVQPAEGTWGEAQGCCRRCRRCLLRWVSSLAGRSCHCPAGPLVACGRTSRRRGSSVCQRCRCAAVDSMQDAGPRLLAVARLVLAAQRAGFRQLAGVRRAQPVRRAQQGGGAEQRGVVAPLRDVHNPVHLPIGWGSGVLEVSVEGLPAEERCQQNKGLP